MASCDAVPPVMVISGPNGVGKSSLLYALKRQVGTVFDGETRVLYQPPHRAVRRQQVRRRWLMSAYRGFADQAAADDVAGYEGLNIQFPQRSPDNVDEAGSTIKYGLGRMEDRRKTAITALVDQRRLAKRKTVRVDELPDVFDPLHRLIARLIPSLRFEGIDFADDENIKLAFTLSEQPEAGRIDLDDLSSGEKAVLLLFLPLIEAEITSLLDQLAPPMASAAAAAEIPDRLFLIDEPEQHLHPELQARVLAYLREEAAGGRLQAVLTTHSPTFLDLASDSELYVLNRPVGTRNQLSRVATSQDRLEALKGLVGNPYFLTTGRSIVLVEGPPYPATTGTDTRLLSIINPASTRYVFVPVGGRGNGLAAVRGLRRYVPESAYGISVLGIVDRDRGDPKVDGVVTWPVCTIENLLLNPAAILRTARTFDPTVTVTEADVEAHFLAVGVTMRDEEVRLRVAEYLQPKPIRLKGLTIPEVQASLGSAFERVTQSLSDQARLTSEIKKAGDIVDSAMSDASFLRSFRGKELLQGVYRRLRLTNVPYEQFLITLAKECRSAPSVVADVNSVFDALDEARAQRLSQAPTGSPATRT